MMVRRRKSLLKKHEVQTAKRRRKCKNTGEAICRGETCLVIWDAQYDPHTYSREIAIQMIADAREVLDTLESSL